MNYISQSTNFLSSLPIDIQFQIFSYLPDKITACVLPQVCKAISNTLKNTKQQEIFWKDKSIALMGKDLGENFFSEYKAWKTVYFFYKKMPLTGKIISSKEFEYLSANGIVNVKIVFKDCKLIGQATGGDGRIVDGEFNENCKLHGVGKVIHSKNDPTSIGVIVAGIFKHNFLVEGTKIHADGKIENGKFSHGWLNGEGMITYSNGAILKGNFDFEICEGTKTYADGTKEEGTFKHETMIKGTKTYPDGTKEQGEFGYSGFEKGTKIYPDGLREEGKFERGEWVGGIRIHTDGKTTLC